jgi:H+-transporting ATPase
MAAPQVIEREILDSQERKEYLEKIEELAEKGLRTVSLGIVKNDKFILVGIFPILDPPREDSKEVLAEIHKKGILVKMITGDNSLIAKFVGKLLNLKSENIYAEVIPKEKYKIVSELQSQDYIVAMTGDGVNDAPALKKADIGIAVAGASPAARSAADLILLDKGLSVISTAIDEARKTFERMHSYATFRISETIRIIFFISLSVLIFGYSPLSATMIILLALLNDIPVMAIAYDNAKTSEKPIR